MTHSGSPGSQLGKERRLLITGAAGFIGVNAAAHFADRGWSVVGFDNLSRRGAERNLEWLRRTHPKVEFARGDVRDAAALREVVTGADAVLHLAAQVAVTTSLADPVLDFDVNARGTLNLLEAVREAAAKAPVVFASTNKVYGALESWEMVKTGQRWVPSGDPARAVAETEPLDLHSPYGCSKGAADQYVRDYARCFGLRTVVMRQSCVYGPHQNGTEDQGWVAHFVRSVLSGTPITIYGDGAQVRDLLDVADLCDLYELALTAPPGPAGGVYNVGGGPANAHSVGEVLAAIEAVCGRPAAVRYAGWRQGDQAYYVSALDLARAELGWSPRTPFEQGLQALVRWIGADLESEPPELRAAAQAATA